MEFGLHDHNFAIPGNERQGASLDLLYFVLDDLHGLGFGETAEWDPEGIDVLADDVMPDKETGNDADGQERRDQKDGLVLVSSTGRVG